MVQKLRKRFIIVAMLSTLIVLLSIIGGMNILNFHKLISQADTMTRMICENDGKFPQSKNEPAPGDDKTPPDSKNNASDTFSPDNGNNTNNNQSDNNSMKNDNSSDSKGNPNPKQDNPAPPDKKQAGDNTNNSLSDNGSQKNNSTATDKNSADNKTSDKEPGNAAPPKAPDRQMDAETPFSTRYFSVKVNNKGTITASNLDSIVSVSSSDLDSYISAVKSKRADAGFYKQFRYKRYKTKSYTLYIFIDCNQGLSTFKNTLLTSLLMSGIGFITVLILVIIFSKIVLRPVAQSYEKQRQFITDAGHELKTPLTIIDANTEVIEMENGESQWTKSIRNQVDRLTTMVGQFITLSKMEEKNENFHKANISLNLILNESLEPFDIIFSSKNIEVKTSLETDSSLSGDEKLIRQLFEILIDNAAKYASENSTFNISVKRKGRKNMIVFENESNNIFQGNLDMLFDRFYRTDASRNSATGGSGIGLSVAKSIVSLHGGTIHAVSDDGRLLRIIILM